MSLENTAIGGILPPLLAYIRDTAPKRRNVEKILKTKNTVE